MCRHSGSSVIGVLAQLGRLKTENDVVAWNACAYQFLCNAQIGSVVLQPNLAIQDVDMNQNCVYALVRLSSDFAQMVMALSFIPDEFGSQGLCSRCQRGDFLQNLPDYGSIVSTSIHLVITSCST